ncbi:MAG: MurR/RpiR family transcriptional regulator [Spirochaetales bacterium]
MRGETKQRINLGQTIPSLLEVLEEKKEQFPPVQKRIAQYILSNPRTVLRMSISTLAERSGAKSEASVVKLYRALGFSGYHDFKVSLATEVAGRTINQVDEESEITLDDTLDTIMKKIYSSGIRVLTKTMESLDPVLLEKAVDLLVRASRVVILGYGTSVVVAYDAFIKFSRVGLDCLYTQDPHINALVLAEDREGDVLFCISQSGESKDVVIPPEALKPKVPIIALTGSPDSPLGQIADICFTVSSRETAFRTDPMIGRVAEIALVDTLFNGIVVRLGNRALERLARSRQALSYLKF